MITTRVYKNTSKEDLIVNGNEIPAGEQVSITTEYHQPVIVENYPGLKEITDEVAEPKKEEKDEQNN